MHICISTLALAATLISSTALVQALSPSDTPSDTPLSSLLSSASDHLRKGETNDALTYYDLAISRDPENYNTHFVRGAAYLSLGRTTQAARDFDKVLAIRPKHEQALLQRAKIRAKFGDWDGANKDYTGHGKATQELTELLEAQGAASLAADAERNGEWEECIVQSGAAILIASSMLSLRGTRAHCRFETGRVEEGVGDLKRVLHLQPGLTDPHMQISAISFYALGDLELGLEQMRKCLQSDPDNKNCKKLYRREKTLEKQLGQVQRHFSKKQYATGLKLLNPSEGESGIVQELKDDIKELKDAGTIPASAPNSLVAQAVERLCEAYHELKNRKKAVSLCKEALEMNEASLYGLLSKSQQQTEAENYEAAIATLNTAKEHHPEAQQQIEQVLQNASTGLKRSKTKDYYKVLGLSRDADEVQIKAAYRKMVKQHHPDKTHKLGISKEEAEKKMASINEAYEVLSDPELKTRFDRGDDPNDHQSQRQHPFQAGGFGASGPVFQQFHQGAGGGGQQFKFSFQGGGFPGGAFPFG